MIVKISDSCRNQEIPFCEEVISVFFISSIITLIQANSAGAALLAVVS